MPGVDNSRNDDPRRIRGATPDVGGAFGVEIREVPLTPARIHRLIEEAARGE